MKQNKLSITVGIPAYNEEANIAYLIAELLSQNQEKFIIEKIIVSSDGSTDGTVKEVTKNKSKKIILVDNKNRTGRALVQNKIMQMSNSEVLVLVDADIEIKDKNFLEKIIEPIRNKGADLTSASVQELKPNTFLGKVLEVSMKFKKFIFENHNNGNNLYTCHGRARAFSKKLYKNITFKESTGEDAYSYFYAISKGYKYNFAKRAKVFYQLPDNFNDHEKQSIRFYKTLSLMEKDFGKELVEKENYLTGTLLLINLGKYILVNPLILIYFFIATFLKIKSLLIKDLAGAWTIAQSSKNLRRVK